MDYKLYLDFAIDISKEAAQLLLKYYNKNLDYELKEDRSRVTKADLEAEKIILDKIKKKFPEHAILSEESGRNDNQSHFFWIVDPLDGTSNFSTRIPFFAISIALCYKNEPVVGVVNFPIQNEIFSAVKGEGAFLNKNNRLNITDEELDSENSFISITNAHTIQAREQAAILYSKIKPNIHRLRTMGAAALELAFMSCSRINGFILVGNNAWDVSAGVLLIKEAGGVVTDFKNNSWSLESKTVLAASPKIHQKLLEFTKKSN